MIKLLWILFAVLMLVSCESNALKQEYAEKTIKEYITNNPLESTQHLISLPSINKNEKTDVFTEHHTKVKVIFNPEGSQEFALNFIFKRTPRDQWFLQSIKADGSITQPVADWLSTKKNLNIAAQ